MNAATTRPRTLARAPLRDLLRLYRVVDWLHFLPMPMAGWLATSPRDLLALAAGVLGWALALAYTAAINQAFDARVDWSDPAKNPVGKRFTQMQAVFLALPFAAASIAVVWLLVPAGLPAAACLVCTATLYSAPPRLKRVPLVGTLWNVAVGAPGLFFAGGHEALLEPPLRLFVGLFALLLVVSQLIHEGEDADDDRQGGVPTLATHLGGRGVLLLAAALLLATPAATFALAGPVPLRWLLVTGCAVFALAFALAFAHHLRLRGPSRQLRPLRLAFRYASLALGALAFYVVLR